MNAGGITSAGLSVNALEQLDVPVLQTMAASVPQASWELSSRGLNPLETAINVAIPEFDGRIITVPISFKERQSGHDGALYSPHPERIARGRSKYRLTIGFASRQTKSREENRVHLDEFLRVRLRKWGTRSASMLRRKLASLIYCAQ